MVSTRSHSVLSADAAQREAAAAQGEVNSAAAPTPRRSGRVRSSGGTASGRAAASPAAERAPPRSTRSVRTRRQLGAIEEEEQQVLGQGLGNAATPAPKPKSPAAPAALPAAAGDAAADAAAEAEAQAEPAEEQQQQGQQDAAGAAEVAETPEQQQQRQADGLQPLKAEAAVVDVLAQEMFAALESAFGQHSSSDGDEDSDEEEGEEEEEQEEDSSSSEASDAGPEDQGKGERQQGAAATSQQQEQATEEEEDGGSGSDDGDSGSEGEGEGEGAAGRHVPRHLRWQPDLLLPGMGPGEQQGSQPPRPTGGSGSAAAVGVHAVRRGKDALHVPPPDARALQKAARREAPDTAGKAWFDLPATQITDEVKNDLRMLRLRGALDPKSFYKKFDTTKFPKHFQMGTVVEGAADFYSGRLTNKQRKRTFTEEIMADSHLAEVRKKRYTQLQEERSYWSKKKPGRKTDNERKKKAHHRPKH